MSSEWLKPYPVAMIPYVNMLPYRLLGPPPHCCWYDYVPRDSVTALAAGKVVAAAVPVGALPGLEALVEPLGHYGIAARESSMSVLFFSAQPFERIRIHDRMQLTPDSATSVRLLYLLLSCQPTPDLEGAQGTADHAVGELMIGDRAMQCLHAWRQARVEKGQAREWTEPYAWVTDLATCWYAAYGRPFVFARWVIRRDAPPAARAALMGWLEAFARQEDALIDRSIPLAAQRLGLPAVWFARYYRCLRRILAAEDLEGQALFLDEIGRRQIDRFVTPALSGGNGTWLSPLMDSGRPVSAGVRVAPSIETRAERRRPQRLQREAP